MMEMKWKVMAAVGVLFATLVAATAQTKNAGNPQAVTKSAYTAQNITQQKARLDQTLQKRAAEIEKRFMEEQGFRAKMKDQRLGFEKKMVENKKSFLDSLKSIKPENHREAWQAFFQQQREKRGQFRLKQREESKQYWQARRATGYNQPPSSKMK